MFTPQKKLWSGWPLTPRTDKGQGNGSGSGLLDRNSSPRSGEAVTRGKSLALLESTPRREDYGVLDKDALTNKLIQLESELFDYQYNMGLILIEKKDWTSKYNELNLALEEANDALKREQAAHSISISEIEKREENLRKALGVEQQCVLELEKALRQMRSEHAEIKFTADSKLAEARALVTSVEEKSLEIEAKIRAAEAKLAEVSRRSTEIERRSKDVEAQESAHRRERSVFSSEREAHEVHLAKQREDLREWEKKMQEAEERLAEGRRLLNQREQRSNENDRMLKEKQNDLEEAQKKIDIANLALRNKEDEINSRIGSLSIKEKEVDAMRKSLEMKEKQLIEMEENLDARERVEMQKLLDEHNSFLGSKKEEFELEMEQKRRSLDEELKDKVSEVEKKEAELNHVEEKIRKREQALEKKMEKMKEKEKGLDSKCKTLKEKEKVLKSEEKVLEVERKRIATDKENLDSFKVELENLRAELEKQQLTIREEQEQLKVTEDERLEHARLQAELKQEIDKCRLQSELLAKDAEDLKLERDSFEKDWEKLDERRFEIDKELQEIAEQRRNLQKFKHTEEERLNNERLETQNYVQRELEALKVAKDTFAASMEQEQLMLAEKTRSERSQMDHDFELQKRNLETEMQRKLEQMELSLQEREKLFEEEKERVLKDINQQREVSQRELQEMALEGLKLEKEKKEISENKKLLEVQQSGMRKDIEELVSLSRKLKEQREMFIKERERFITFIEPQKNCSMCGDLVREFLVTDLQSLSEIENLQAPPLPCVGEDYLKGVVQGSAEQVNDELSPGVGKTSFPASGGTVSWLRKCTSRIFKLSPSKKLEMGVSQDLIGSTSPPQCSVNAEALETLSVTNKEAEPSFDMANDCFDVLKQSDTNMREAEAEDASVDDKSGLNSDAQGIPEDSQNLKVQQKAGSRVRLWSHRTRPLKAVDIEAKDGPDDSDGPNVNGIAQNSTKVNEESLGESNLDGEEMLRNGRKRNRARASQMTTSEEVQDGGQSDSVTTGGRKKRRQKVAPVVQSPAGKRYNLRRPRTVAFDEANGPRKGKGKEVHDQSEGNDIPSSKVNHPEEVCGESGGDTSYSQALPPEVPRGDETPVHEASTDGPRFQAAAGTLQDVDGADDFKDEVVSSEEVGTPEVKQGQKNGEVEEDDDEEVEHPGEVSIGKKLWTFLTT